MTCLEYLRLIGLFTLHVEKQRGEAVEDIQAKRQQKRLAKQKLKQMQMAGVLTGNKRSNVNLDEESEGEEDESSEQLNQVLREFANVKTLVETLFKFMFDFIFDRDATTIALIQKYDHFEELIKILVLQTENFMVRGEAARKLNQVVLRCSGQKHLSETMNAFLRVLLLNVLPSVYQNERRCEQYCQNIQRTLEEIQVSDMQPLENDLWQLAQ